MDTSPRKGNAGTVIVTALVTAAVCFGGFYLYLQTLPLQIPVKSSDQPTDAAKTTATMVIESPAREVPATETTVSEGTDIPENVTVFYGDGPDKYELVTLHGGFSQNLYRQLKQGKRELLVENIQEKHPEIEHRGLSYVTSFKDRAVFAAYLPDTDSGLIAYYSFDLNNPSFTKMKINEVYQGSFEPMAQYYGGGLIAYAPAVQEDAREKLYVLNLEDDTYRQVAALKLGESFGAGSGGLSNFSSIEWIGDNKIRFAVFDKTKQDGFDFMNPYASLIEYREITF